jgi:hypothetical protein
VTRFLSEALQVSEDKFRTDLRRLEAAHGNPSHDIRLTSRINQQARAKLLELGLDPFDTTAEELYHVLAQRVKTDDAKLTRTLQTQAALYVSAEANVVAGMAHVLSNLPNDLKCFAIKPTSMKALIKQLPPKKAMKQLGYRSLASFLKHEKLALVLVAAWITESSSWHKQFIDSYKQLKSSDFEERKITVLSPSSKHWVELVTKLVDQKKHTIFSLKEFGTVILLPLPKQILPGIVTASLTLALHDINDIRATSSYLKICQLRPGFGELVSKSASEELTLNSKTLDHNLSWHLIQRYYGRTLDRFREELFGPHVVNEDMSWQAVEETLAAIDPTFKFWLNSAHLGVLHNHEPVSLNIVDVAINLCNNLPFEQRIKQAFQSSLWHELLLEYLNHDTVEQTVLGQLEPERLVAGVSN